VRPREAHADAACHATAEPNTATEVGVPGFRGSSHGPDTEDSADQEGRQRKVSRKVSRNGKTHDAHHVGFDSFEGADRKLRNGARTLDDFGRFTVQPTGQIRSNLIADETPSILTAYEEHGIGFSMKCVTGFSRLHQVW
jgi:hypothetical protein